MGVLSKLFFWKKKKFPELPEEELLPHELPPIEPQRDRFSLPEQPRFEEQRYPPPQQQNNQFEVISAKLDVLNAKLEVLNEKVNNIEKNLQDAKVRW